MDQPVVAALPDIPGVLSAQELVATASSIAEVQLHDGMIPWFEGGHCDPWNHVESAMALSVGGLHKEAALAYQWLADSAASRRVVVQLLHGDRGCEGSSPRHQRVRLCRHRCLAPFRVTGDVSVLAAMWPVLDKALEFVLRFQREDGADLVVRRSRRPSGALPAAHRVVVDLPRAALWCGLRRRRWGDERPDWELAAGRLAHTIAHAPEVFEPKHEFAMDWYYPVLSGALSGEAAAARIDAWWDTFVMDGRGVRCVSTGPWVTAAETAECALALDAVGRRRRGRGSAHLDAGAPA